MSLNRLFQIVVAEEVSSGVAVASLVASGNVPNYGIADPAASFSPESYTRDVLRGSLTPTSPIQGATGGTISFRVELTGH
ncbi:MAG TPA: hypothetical protein VM537_22725, partial [Anaerolineae bacterium]|nr:hypothetical protein [Anaerolineae bacterium]